MTLDLHTVKEDFAVMVQKVQPWTLSQFVMWLDLKVAEYKVHGYMILDYEGHLNQLFATESKKPPSKNVSFTNAGTVPVRTAPSRNSAQQTSVINIDADDSPPPPPTAPAQNATAHLRSTNAAQVIDLDIAQSLPSNSRNIQSLYARNCLTVESDLTVPTISPPLTGYTLSKNTANVPTTQYTTHNGQHTKNSNGLRTSLTHPRSFNSNQSQLVNSDNTIIVSGSRGSNGVSFSQQPTVTRGYIPGEQTYQNPSSIQHINIDPEPEQDLDLVQVEPQMGLLMDVECENDNYAPDNWNSSATLSSGDEKQLLQNSIGMKNGSFPCVGPDRKISNNLNNIETINEPVPEIKLEDVKHCTEDSESFALNIENSDSCNRLLNTEDCLRIDDSDSDIECDNNHESQQDSLTDQVWSSEDSAREPSNLPQSSSKRRYITHRIKPLISLPSFSGYLQTMLESGKAQFVWSKLVEQCAYHILAQKDIREKHDYREFCQALYQRYPSIGLEGPQPWSHFSKTLSQKIRHIRWQHKKRSTECQKTVPPGVATMTATPTTTIPSPITATPTNNISAGPSGNNSLISNEIKEDISCTTSTTQMVKKCEDV